MIDKTMLLEAAAGLAPYRIIEARPGHGALMASTLPPHERAAFERLGEDPADSLSFLLANSPYRRAALIGGVPVAIWGATKNDSGIWWQIAPQAQIRRFAIAREARRELAEMLDFHGLVTLSLRCTNTASRRFAQHLGFAVTGQGMASGQPFQRLIARRGAE